MSYPVVYSSVIAVKQRFLWKLSDNVYLPAYALTHTWHIPEGVLELMWLEGPPPPPLPQRAARRAPDSHGNRTTLLTTTGWQNWFRLVFKCSVTSLLTYPVALSFHHYSHCWKGEVHRERRVKGCGDSWASAASEPETELVKTCTVSIYHKDRSS